MDPVTFGYSESDFIHQTAQWVDKLAPQESKFDDQLLHQWQASMDAGAFRYTVDHIQMRRIPGPKKYLALLNALRGTERRKPQQITSIQQPVNPNAFNFTTVKSDEIIFNLKRSSAVTPTDSETDKLKDSDNHCNGAAVDTNTLKHSVLINNSPINKGHCLLVPEKSLCKPQVLTETSIRVALETILLSRHRGFTLGFNSLLAFASVNHLHWHIVYIPQELLAFYCPVRHLAGCYYEFTAYPIHGFVVQLHGSSVEEVARHAHGISSFLHQSDIAHNAFVCRGVAFGEEATSSLTTIRLFIWPRKKFLGDQIDEPFNLACVELPGFLVMKDPKAFETFTEKDVDAVFEANRLDDSDFSRIRDHVIALGTQNGVSKK